MKKALPTAGLVAKQPARGRHRRRREPRPCFGEWLHLDGSRHQWLALVPDQWLPLLVVVDDATKRVWSAELRDGGERVAAILAALRTVLERPGVPSALYTDRAHWAVHTPTSGSAPERRPPTHVGRALARLGPLQLAKQPGRRPCAGLRVLVRRHLNGHHSVWYGPRCLGRFDGQGQPLRAA